MQKLTHDTPIAVHGVLSVSMSEKFDASLTARSTHRVECKLNATDTQWAIVVRSVKRLANGDEQGEFPQLRLTEIDDWLKILEFCTAICCKSLGRL
uniref:Uncharacterized protein n=1 Tax=Romanomermis culicivorax TaxID=13658 RepID=A0A915KYQ2_ROMCU